MQCILTSASPPSTCKTRKKLFIGIGFYLSAIEIDMSLNIKTETYDAQNNMASKKIPHIITMNKSFRGINLLEFKNLFVSRSKNKPNLQL